MGEVFQDVGTGKSKFVAHEETETCKYAILGSTSVIGYDDSFDYEGDFILTARVGANAGTMYRHRGQVKISDNTVYLKGDNLDYMQALLTNFDLTKLSFGTGQPLIKSSELQRVDIFVSTSEEQQKLGNFFRTLDSSIAMQKRKCEGLRKLKAAYLQQMFPQSGERMPRLRFERFSGEWEVSRLDEVFSPSVPNNTLSRAALNYDDGEIRNLHYGDVLMKFGAFVDSTDKVIPFITNAKVSDFKSHLLQDGDIVFADTAEDEMVGKAVEVTNTNNANIVSGLHTYESIPQIV